MTLLELQRRMLGDLRVPPDVAAVPGAREQGARDYLSDSPRLNAQQRLDIYRRSCWARLREAVAEDFPALRAIVGRQRFAALIDAYLLAHPSRSWTLRNLSRSLPAWLATNPHHAGRRWRAAVDAARLEWAYIESFDAASRPPLSPERIASLGADSPLCLQPHLRLLDLGWNVDDLVVAVHREEGESPDRSGKTLPTIRPRKIYLAVHRVDGLVYYRRLDKFAFRILDALQRNRTLAEAVNACLESPPHAGSAEDRIRALQQTLALAGQLGWIC